MTARTKAHNLDELISLVNQALTEVEELRASIDKDHAFKAEASVIVEPLNKGLNRLLASINTGQYQPGQSDLLDFIEALKDIDHRAVPCWPVLKLILETHHTGFQESSEPA